jgi:hypothetical protein
MERNLFNNQILNNYLVSANQQGNPYSNQAIVIPIMQTPQGNIQQQMMMQSQPNNMNNYPAQLLPQNMKPKMINPMNNMPTANPTTPDIKKNGDANPVSEGFMKEFQSRILGLLFTQNKMLIDLKDKNEILQDTLACLINEINALK